MKIAKKNFQENAKTSDVKIVKNTLLHLETIQ